MKFLYYDFDYFQYGRIMKSKNIRIAFISWLTCLSSVFFNIAIAQTPIVSLPAAYGGETQEGVGNLFMEISIMNPNENETTVQIARSGTATHGVDYTTSPDTIFFPPGSSESQRLYISYPDDCVDEPNETIILTLINPTNGAQIGIGSMTSSILDDDPLPAEDCTYTVPSNSNVVTTTFNFFNHNRRFWVCDGGNVTLRSSLHKVLVENGGIVRSEGDRTETYVKSGGTVIVDDGEQNIIFAEDGANVTILSGLCNIVFAGAGASFVDNGTETISGELTCGPLDIDYSTAPIAGCMISSSQYVGQDFDLELFPNPSTGHFEIRYTGQQTLRSIEIFNQQGGF